MIHSSRSADQAARAHMFVPSAHVFYPSSTNNGICVICGFQEVEHATSAVALTVKALDSLNELIAIAGMSSADVRAWVTEHAHYGPSAGFESDYQIGMIRARIQALCFELGQPVPYR